MPVRPRLAVVLIAAACATPAATASYGVTNDGGGSPALRVDAGGSAEVSWTERGARRSFVVPQSGQGRYGRLSGADVSKPATAAIPFRKVVRQTADGTFWALQQWRVAGRPPSLDLARWKGEPTQITLRSDGTRLTGRVSYHGRAVSGTSSTVGGKRIRIQVYVECLGCEGDRWSLLLGVAPKSDGSFSILLRPSWQGRRYRASVAGPNIGGDLAPDAQATTSR